MKLGRRYSDVDEGVGAALVRQRELGNTLALPVSQGLAKLPRGADLEKFQNL